MRRPEPVDFSMEYVTPDLRSTGEQCAMVENLSNVTYHSVIMLNYNHITVHV